LPINIYAYPAPPREEIACESLDCPWPYERAIAEGEVQIWKGVPIEVSEFELGDLNVAWSLIPSTT